MLVVDVWTLVDPSALRMSAGSPDLVSTIAVIEFQVRWATCRSEMDAADAPAAGTSASTAASDAIDRALMAAAKLPSGYVREPCAFRHMFVWGHVLRRFHPEEASMGRAGRRASAIAVFLLL